MKILIEDRKRCNTAAELKGRRLPVKGGELMEQRAFNSCPKGPYVKPQHMKCTLHTKVNKALVCGQHLGGGKLVETIKNT